MPGVQAWDTEWLEVLHIASHHGHLGSLRDRRNQCIVERRVLGCANGRKDTRSWKVEWQDASSKRWQDPALKPSSQYGALVWVHALLRNHSAFQFSDRQ